MAEDIKLFLFPPSDSFNCDQFQKFWMKILAHYLIDSRVDDNFFFIQQMLTLLIRPRYFLCPKLFIYSLKFIGLQSTIERLGAILYDSI